MATARNYTVRAIVALGLAALAAGFLGHYFVAIACGVGCAAIVTIRRRRSHHKGPSSRRGPDTPKPTQKRRASTAAETPRSAKRASSPGAGAISDMDAYVDLLLRQGRHMLLLRPQIAENLRPDQLEQAVDAMQEDMALVPEGEVFLAQPNFEGEGEAVENAHGSLVAVQAFYLDRYPVTNREFGRFVEAGGYEESALWDPAVLAGVLDFVDRTGELGPRFWHDGMYPDGQDDHPVVGVCWYEAQAYCRWVGKRLPIDPEWVKAGSWPVPTPGSTPQQRRYPWGNTMDGERANLWASGSGSTVSVLEYADGVSVGGVYQLIGNVWEWTSGVYGSWHSNERRVEGQDQFKSLRGGAFDTYFDSHAVCQFQSGDNPLARKHNIGFRGALGLCDVTPAVLQTLA